MHGRESRWRNGLCHHARGQHPSAGASQARCLRRSFGGDSVRVGLGERTGVYSEHRVLHYSSKRSRRQLTVPGWLKVTMVAVADDVSDSFEPLQLDIIHDLSPRGADASDLAADRHLRRDGVATRQGGGRQPKLSRDDVSRRR